MTQRVADDFAAIRKRMEELTAQEELKHAPESFETDTGDEHTIAVQPSTGKRYKWINGSWTEEEFTLTSLGPIDHKPSPYWQNLDPTEQEAHTLLDYMI